MEGKGTLIIQAYTARMALPIQDVSVIITSDQGENQVIAYRKTDRNGQTVPVEIETPSLALTLVPSGQIGFATCNILLYHPMYYRTLIEHVQIFPQEESIQGMEMIPLEEHAAQGEKSRVYTVSPQDL